MPPETTGTWLRRGSWTVMDQGLFAGSNFLVNVLLARWLAPADYGAFTMVSFVALLLVGVVHSGLLTEPMLVFGPGPFEQRRRPYLRLLLRGHLLFSLAVAPLLAVAGWASAAVFGHPELTWAFLALAVAQGAILLMWMLRRACYVFFRPEVAVTGGLLYAAATAAGLLALSTFGALSATGAVLLMGGASLLAAALILLRLRVFDGTAAPDALRTEALAAHRGYSGWATATGGLEWVQGLLPFLVLPIWHGLEAAGTFRALFNLVMPVMHAYGALSLLLVPTFVRARAAGRLKQALGAALGTVLGATVAYGLAIGVGGAALLGFLYGHHYTAHAGLLWLFALYPVFGGMATVLGALRRAEERPKATFRARGGAATLMATAGTALIHGLGLVGAILADCLASLTEALLLAAARTRATKPADAAVLATEAPGGDGVATPRLKVLVSAFACLPDWGSEPGIGWNFSRLMARHHDVWVLTYAGFRKQIEAAARENPVPGVHYVYYKLPFEDPAFADAEVGRFRSGLREQLHYHLWQLGAARVARRLHREVGFDLAHHVTYAKYWAPSALAGLPVPFIWGPVGGGEATPRAFYGWLSRAALRYERARDVAQALMRREPNVRRTARRAAFAFATTEETRAEVRRLGARHVEVLPGIALPDGDAAALAQLPMPDDGPVRFISIGRLLGFKGFNLGLHAFAEALRRDASTGTLEGAEYWVVGDGMERPALERLAEELGLAERVRFFGALSLEQTMRRLGASHVLVHPSLHESGGGVCLEAMAAGRPVVCLEHGGPAVLVPPEAGVRIPPDDPEQVVREMARALRDLAADPARRRAMGAAGRAHVLAHHCWSHRVAEMDARYHAVAGRPSAPTLAVPTVTEPVLEG
ncbi:MAG TPA: glycosyltransferase [Rubricoccaceae bacterium]|nr:glycosyltransferase [Rubricoccaceae bacterium]